MVTVTIDGKEVQVADGTNLVDAARKAGVHIPTYCYHPGLTVVGQCRICFVEVEGLPRLVTACSTLVQDGMKVLTASDRVREARAAVMEFLLANHPLDCPVCDQAGECLLQDYSVAHGMDSTHMVDVKRTFPGKERRLIGPHVMQNQNRCIHCTRCIRFTREVVETADLTMKSRGNHAYIDTFDGRPLDNPWSACAADVCPVGALTVKEFRFRARVWHLTDTPSLCPGCSIGCNIYVGHLDGTVHRFVPRENREVNGWWMCDYGRFLAESVNGRDISAPTVQGDSSGGWERAIEAIAKMVDGQPGTRVLASANLSNEALYLAKKLFVEHLGLQLVVPVERGEPRRMKNGRGDWLSSHDGHPNLLGATLMGLQVVDDAALAKWLQGTSGGLIVLDNQAHSLLAAATTSEQLQGATVAVFGRLHTPLSRAAEVVVPTASWIETEGSYTSSTGRVQLASRGLFPRGMARTNREILSMLATRLGLEVASGSTPSAVFEALARDVPAYAGMTYPRLRGEAGLPVLEEAANVG